MPARGSTRRAARAANTISRSEIASNEFTEPHVAPDSHLGLKTTGHSIAHLPDRDALVAIEDPERIRRQHTRGGATRSRRLPKAKTETSDLSDSPDSERLYLRLKRKLAPTLPDNDSDVRETPDRGADDYRHDRQIQADNGRKRRRKAAGAQTPDSPNQRSDSRNKGQSLDGDQTLGEPELVPDGMLNQPKETSLGSNTPLDPEPTVTSDAKTDTKLIKSEDAEDPGSVDPSPTDSAAPGLELNKKDLVNNDFCTSCGGTGELVCCETCTHSFHFSCIEPPVMEVEEITEAEWSCRSCQPRPLSDAELEDIKGTLFEPLILSSTSHNAMAFQMPSNIQEMFEHIEATKYGEFLEESAKVPHLPPVHRIQDKEGNFLLCFKCRGTGLNERHLAVCSKCQEPWHIDCLDPPLESTPFGHWVCPLHAGRGKDVVPLRVRNPQFSGVGLKRHIKNNGDIEVDDEDSTDDEHITDGDTTVDVKSTATGRVSIGDAYQDEDSANTPHFPSQTKVNSKGEIVSKIQRHRPRGFEQDRQVYKVSSRTIKLDFLDAVHKMRAQPYRDSPSSDFMYGLNILAEQPQSESEAVRNLMLLRLSGPSVSTAAAKDNVKTLVEAALDDDNEIGQIVAIRKLMKEKGKERLLDLLNGA